MALSDLLLAALLADVSAVQPGFLRTALSQELIDVGDVEDPFPDQLSRNQCARPMTAQEACPVDAQGAVDWRKSHESGHRQIVRSGLRVAWQK
jgi:hypothetical protein